MTSTASDFWLQETDSSFTIMDQTCNLAVLVAFSIKCCNTKLIIGNVNINNFTGSSFVIYFL